MPEGKGGAMREHGWQSAKNGGNYGVYGWGLGLWHSRGVASPGQLRESSIVVQLGPWKWMWTKVERVKESQYV